MHADTIEKVGVMIGKRKDVFEGGRTLTAEFDGFGFYGESGDKLLRATYSRNCDCRGGVLTSGIGVKQHLMGDGTDPEVPDNRFVRNIYPFWGHTTDKKSLTEIVMLHMKKQYIFAYDETYAAYEQRMIVGTEAEFATYTTNELEHYLYIATSRGLYVYSVAGTSFAIVGNIATSVCVCKNRVYTMVKPYKLAFCDPDLPMDFSQKLHISGTIAIPQEKGLPVALRNFHDTVYVFFEYGFVRVHVGGEPTEFRVEKCDYSGGKIFGKTVGVCGEAILFLASDGAYRYDGSKTERICTHLKISPADDSVCSHAEFEGLYTVGYTDKDGSLKNLVLYDDGESGYFAEGFSVPSGGGGRGFCLNGSRIGLLSRDGELQNGATYTFESEALELGTGEKKALKKVRFEGEGSFTLTVKSDGRERAYTMNFENGVAERRLREYGRAFRFGISPEKGAKIRKMALEYVRS